MLLPYVRMPISFSSSLDTNGPPESPYFECFQSPYGENMMKMRIFYNFSKKKQFDRIRDLHHKRRVESVVMYKSPCKTHFSTLFHIFYCRLLANIHVANHLIVGRYDLDLCSPICCQAKHKKIHTQRDIIRKTMIF